MVGKPWSKIPRGRSWKPVLTSLLDSDKINSVSIEAESLYVRMLLACDDAGRYPADPGWICARLLTARVLAKQVTTPLVTKWLEELKVAGLLTVYEFECRSYVQITNHFVRQRADVLPQVLFPGPVEFTGRENTATTPCAGRARSISRPGRGTLDVDVDVDVEIEVNSASALSASEKPKSKRKPKEFDIPFAADFEEWWRAYPRRTAKGKAAIAWNQARLKICTRPGMTSAQAIALLLEAATEYAATPAGQRGNYVPFPATWLNQARYEDDRREWQRADGELSKRDAATLKFLEG